MNSLSLPCLGNLNIYISVEGFIMQLHLNYICVFIDMFVHLRMVYVMLCLYMLYNILVGYTSSWFLFYISPVYGSFQQCVIVISVIVFFLWMLYLYLLQYVCVLHAICSLVALNLGNLGVHIYTILFVMPFFHPSWPTFKIVNLHIFVWIICHMHWNT